jgi:hypothetical protein
MHAFLWYPVRLIWGGSAAGVGVVFGLMAGLSACTPVTLSETTLTPSVDTWFLRNGYDWNFYCGLSVIGTAPSFTPDRGGVLVGFENYFDEGSGLFPCQQKHDLAYRGVVRFDLGGLKNIVTAKLTFGLHWTSRRPFGTTTDSAARRLWLLTGDNVFFQADPLVDLTSDQTSFTIDVSTIVRDWVNGTTPNRGFVLSGPNESFPENNDDWVSSYTNFQLDVVYNPM